MTHDPFHLVPLLSPTSLAGEQFRTLTIVPLEAEWFANLHSGGTRWAYQPVIRDFMRFVGITTPSYSIDRVAASKIAYLTYAFSEVTDLSAWA